MPETKTTFRSRDSSREKVEALKPFAVALLRAPPFHSCSSPSPTAEAEGEEEGVLEPVELNDELLDSVLEELQDIADAQARLQDVSDPIVPWEEVKRELGLS